MRLRKKGRYSNREEVASETHRKAQVLWASSSFIAGLGELGLRRGTRAGHHRLTILEGEIDGMNTPSWDVLAREVLSRSRKPLHNKTNTVTDR